VKDVTKLGDLQCRTATFSLQAKILSLNHHYYDDETPSKKFIMMKEKQCLICQLFTAETFET
jgi:hypothetical protein